MAKIFDWKEEIKEEELKQIKEILKNDGVIIFPTDTVYGLGCNCYSENAIKRIFEIKHRSYTKPINVLTDTIEKMEQVTLPLKKKEKEIIQTYMPGNVTIIVQKNQTIPSILTANLPTIGVRIPNHAIALAILHNFDYPLATTSVNLSGGDPILQIEDLLPEFQEKVDIIIDGGKAPIGVPSTILQITSNDEIQYLRGFPVGDSPFCP